VRLTIGITTLGRRPAELRRLLDSIADEHLDAIEIIVVDQSPHGAAHDIACTHTPVAGTPLVCLRSAQGVSAGRNAALEVATGA